LFIKQIWFSIEITTGVRINYKKKKTIISEKLKIMAHYNVQ